jgi:thiamine biosynthesis protein ThiI
LAKLSKGRSFKIEPWRSDKSFPQGSRELANKLGAAVASETGLKVDLSHPDAAIHLDVTQSNAAIYPRKLSDPGGLAVGTAGRVTHFFSGGIDPPVAAWLLMKRGCVPVYLHFYLAPSPETHLESKIVQLIRVLSTYRGKSTLVLARFADYQLATTGVPPDWSLRSFEGSCG